jgi:hypothetical protein
MTLKATSKPYSLISQLQLFHNGERLNFWGVCTLWTDWWIWMKFCIEISDCNGGEYEDGRPDDGGSMNLWNVGLLQRDYMALYLEGYRLQTVKQ